MSDSFSTKAVRIADLRDSIGIGTHMGDVSYGDAMAVDRMLDYTGIYNVRQNAPTNQQTQADIIKLGQLGAKFDMIINGYGPVYLQPVLDTVNTFRPYLNAVEGPNEVDIFPISYGSLYYIDAAMKFQEDMYAALRADPRNDGIDILNFSIGNIPLREFPQLRDMSPYSDYSSIHTYSNRGIRPAFVNPPSVEGWKQLAPDNPVMITESGYYTIPGHASWGGVTEGVQAEYLLDTVLDGLRFNVERTYLYNLVDTAVDLTGTQRDGRFGVFNHDGTAKVAAEALHNFTTILSDAGAGAGTFATTDVAYTVTGLPFTGASQLLQKSDGTHLIAVWNEEQLWNYDAGREIDVRDFDTTVKLDRVYDTVQVYDPMLGSTPIATYRNISSVDMVVSSHPLIVELGKPATGGGTTTQLVLRLSEDAYQGDAQFVVKVDGVQVGGVQTVTARESARQTQDFTFTGPWSPGAHKVTVDFLNDAYDPATGGDRNIYVHSVTFDGVRHNGGTIYAGAADFTVAGGGGTSAPPPAPVPTSGPDRLTLRLSEDAYQGDAQFVVKVDGVQVGGVQTVTARESARQTQDLTLAGTWGPGAHKVTVDFLNDAFDPGLGDRNIYVHSIDLNGVRNGGGIIYAGAVDFSVQGGATMAQPTPVTPTTTASAGTTAGTGTGSTAAAAAAGPDNLVLRLSETPFVGDVQYLVTVDGVQVGNVRHVTALHAAGESQNVVINGDFGAGSHEVRVNFLNDYANDAKTSSRVLHVEDISFNGVSYGGATSYEKGVKTFTVGSGPLHDNSAPRQMVLQLSEDAYQGDAQFTVAVDGVQMGGVRTVTASRAAGHDQDVVLNGNWTPGEHKVTVNFLNDAFGSGAGQDRNLYVETIFFDGKAYTDTTRPLNASGSADFYVGGDRLTLGGPSELVLHMSEYAWNGDAQFVVKVDGVQASGARTVTASRAADHSQEFKFTGNWDAGDHRITIEFLNDAYGGNAAADRNLHVDAIELGGTRHDVDQTIFGGSADYFLLGA